MYGDFEAQRHWMEVTLHLPLREWYYYDTQWWGLDYPPLTAYVSLLFAKLYSRYRSMLMSRGEFINPAWLELDKSRGIESHALKVFMRFTVILSDYLLFIPSLLFYTHCTHPSARKIDKVQIFGINLCVGSRIHTYSSSTFSSSHRSRTFSVQFNHVGIIHIILNSTISRLSSSYSRCYPFRFIPLFQTNGIILRSCNIHLSPLHFFSSTNST
jgi:ALG6, ALG8 glycosyltransferase family